MQSQFKATKKGNWKLVGILIGCFVTSSLCNDVIVFQIHAYDLNINKYEPLCEQSGQSFIAFISII